MGTVVSGRRMPPFYRSARHPSFLGYALLATGLLILTVILLAGLWIAHGAPERKHPRDATPDSHRQPAIILLLETAR